MTRREFTGKSAALFAGLSLSPVIASGNTIEAMPWSFPFSADSYVRLLEAVDRDWGNLITMSS